MGKLYDPRADIVFRKIFGMHKNICMSFLNALLPLDEGDRIVYIENLDPDVLPEAPDKKNSVVVVRCTDSRKRTFLVEMQILWTESFMNCALFNASKAFVAQSKRGMYYDAFRPVYTLSILNENMPDMREFPEEYIHNFFIQDEQHRKLRMGGMVFVFVELMKFKSSTPLHNRLAELWLRFLTFVEKGKGVTVPEELRSDPDVSSAVDCLENMHLTEEERRAYEKYWDAISYERSLAAGKFAEGVLKEKNESIKVMLEEGLDINTMARISRISVEEVERIVEEIRNQR